MNDRRICESVELERKATPPPGPRALTDSAIRRCKEVDSEAELDLDRTVPSQGSTAERGRLPLRPATATLR